MDLDDIIGSTAESVDYTPKRLVVRKTESLEDSALSIAVPKTYSRKSTPSDQAEKTKIKVSWPKLPQRDKEKEEEQEEQEEEQEEEESELGRSLRKAKLLLDLQYTDVDNVELPEEEVEEEEVQAEVTIETANQKKKNVQEKSWMEVMLEQERQELYGRYHKGPEQRMKTSTQSASKKQEASTNKPATEITSIHVKEHESLSTTRQQEDDGTSSIQRTKPVPLSKKRKLSGTLGDDEDHPYEEEKEEADDEHEETSDKEEDANQFKNDPKTNGIAAKGTVAKPPEENENEGDKDEKEVSSDGDDDEEEGFDLLALLENRETATFSSSKPIIHNKNKREEQGKKDTKNKQLQANERKKAQLDKLARRHNSKRRKLEEDSVDEAIQRALRGTELDEAAIEEEAEALLTRERARNDDDSSDEELLLNLPSGRPRTKKQIKREAREHRETIARNTQRLIRGSDIKYPEHRPLRQITMSSLLAKMKRRIKKPALVDIPNITPHLSIDDDKATLSPPTEDMGASGETLVVLPPEASHPPRKEPANDTEDKENVPPVQVLSYRLSQHFSSILPLLAFLSFPLKYLLLKPAFHLPVDYSASLAATCMSMGGPSLTFENEEDEEKNITFHQPPSCSSYLNENTEDDDYRSTSSSLNRDDDFIARDILQPMDLNYAPSLPCSSSWAVPASCTQQQTEEQPEQQATKYGVATMGLSYSPSLQTCCAEEDNQGEDEPIVLVDGNKEMVVQ
ncbi:Nipped-B-like protein B [Balamuthia mandrillaris]